MLISTNSSLDDLVLEYERVAQSVHALRFVVECAPVNTLGIILESHRVTVKRYLEQQVARLEDIQRMIDMYQFGKITH